VGVLGRFVEKEHGHPRLLARHSLAFLAEAWMSANWASVDRARRRNRRNRGAFKEFDEIADTVEIAPCRPCEWRPDDVARGGDVAVDHRMDLSVVSINPA
jgi:hypothetical protein